jgi:hypothetical protein
MGERKNKLKRFLAAHPICCFCGGSNPATTIDHVPGRACFPDRVGPEGFEFPACDRCQSASRLDELAFSFYVKLSDPDDTNYRERDFKRISEGVKNNLPHLFPDVRLSANEVRRSLKAMGLTKPSNEVAENIPVAAVPAEVHFHILRYAWKMACAIYYREQGRIASPDHSVWATWTQGMNKAGLAALEDFIRITPLIRKGQRTNVQIGDRFGYRCNKADEPDVLAALAQFGSGLILAILVVDPKARQGLQGDDWVKVEDIFSLGAEAVRILVSADAGRLPRVSRPDDRRDRSRE